MQNGSLRDEESRPYLMTLPYIYIVTDVEIHQSLGLI